MSGPDDPLMQRLVDLLDAANDDTGKSGVVAVRLRHDPAKQQVLVSAGASTLSALNLVRAAEAVLSIYRGRPGCDCAGCYGVRQALVSLRSVLGGRTEVGADGQPSGPLH